MARNQGRLFSEKESTYFINKKLKMLLGVKDTISVIVRETYVVTRVSRKPDFVLFGYLTYLSNRFNGSS